ncbi:hypothetical protein [Streptomyces naphthomycinicus]|nr:hypothetical protein [Streptomyces sp. TML10]
MTSPLTAATSERIRKDGNSIAHGDMGEKPNSVNRRQTWSASP